MNSIDQHQPKKVYILITKLNKIKLKCINIFAPMTFVHDEN